MLHFLSASVSSVISRGDKGLVYLRYLRAFNGETHSPNEHLINGEALYLHWMILFLACQFIFVLEHSTDPEIEKKGLEKIDYIAGILAIFWNRGSGKTSRQSFAICLPYGFYV